MLLVKAMSFKCGGYGFDCVFFFTVKLWDIYPLCAYLAKAGCDFLVAGAPESAHPQIVVIKLCIRTQAASLCIARLLSALPIVGSLPSSVDLLFQVMLVFSVYTFT